MIHVRISWLFLYILVKFLWGHASFQIMFLQGANKNYLFGGHQTMWMYGKFEELPMNKCSVWVGILQRPLLFQAKELQLSRSSGEFETIDVVRIGWRSLRDAKKGLYDVYIHIYIIDGWWQMILHIYVIYSELVRCFCNHSECLLESMQSAKVHANSYDTLYFHRCCKMFHRFTGQPWREMTLNRESEAQGTAIPHQIRLTF